MQDGGVRRVLVVEDDRDVREVIAEYLQQEGYAAAIAENGLEALHLLNAGLRPQAILLDLLMPAMGGEAFLNWLRADPGFADVPVIIITGVTQPAASTRLSADAVLTKPFEVDDLLSALQRVVAAARQLPPQDPPLAS
jgi:CheY-like chemotaxis protein